MKTKTSTVLLAFLIIITISNFCFGAQSESKSYTYMGEKYWLWVAERVGFEPFNYERAWNRVHNVIIQDNYRSWKENSFEWKEEWELAKTGDDAACLAIIYNITRNELIFYAVGSIKEGYSAPSYTKGELGFSSGGGSYTNGKYISQDVKNYYEGTVRGDGYVHASGWPGQPQIKVKLEKGKVYFKFTTK
jgi:hypothetical protein